MLLQSLLRSGTTPEDLTAKYAIKVKAHRDYPNLLQFKYDQIASLMSEPLVQECRGVILDKDNDWTCIARSFDKFFNLGEPNAATIDWSTAEIQEKLDGSLCIMYWYDGDWRVATSGTPDASGPVGDSGKVFSELFWETFVAQGWHPEPFDSSFTFSFELMSKWNRVVVQHAEPTLKLIGIRDPWTGQELRITPASRALMACAKTFPIAKTPEAILASFDTFSGKDQEGYVVCDANFNRVKVKHPEYLRYHRFIDGMSPKRILDIVRKGESSEVLAYFPEWQKEFDETRRLYEAMLMDAQLKFDSIVKAYPATQKDLAALVTKTPYSACLFALWAGKTPSIRDYYANVRIEHLMAILGRNP